MVDFGRRATYFSTSLPCSPSTLNKATYLYSAWSLSFRSLSVVGAAAAPRIARGRKTQKKCMVDESWGGGKMASGG